MSQPILYQILPFDVTVGTRLTFSYDGNQVFSNEVVITDNTNGQIVYQVKRTNVMSSYHDIAPNSGLKNGGYYTAKIRVFDKDDTPSEYSNLRTFYCFQTPIFGFSNFTEYQIVENSQYTLELTYNDRNQSEPLDTYYVVLYNSTMSILKNSGVIPASTSMSYKLTDLESGSQYFVRAVGTTLNGIVLDTGPIEFSVNYIRPMYWAYVDLQNNKHDGNIKISSNIISIEGTSNPDPPTYLNDSEVDLRKDGTWVKFDDNFIVGNKFCLQLRCRGLVNGETVLMLEGEDSKIELKYIEGYFNSFSKTDKCSYIVLRMTQAGTVYTLISNLIAIPDSKEMIHVWLKKVGPTSEIKIENLGTVEPLSDQRGGVISE